MNNSMVFLNMELGGISCRHRSVYVGLSGGVDSMVMTDFLMRHNIKVCGLFFDHKTEHEGDNRKFVENYCNNAQIELIVGEIDNSKFGTRSRSKEEFWRIERYEFFNQFIDKPVCIGHHLDDVLETWVASCAQGNPKLIPYERNHCIRPMIGIRKQEIRDYAEKYDVPFIEDPSNQDNRFTRNRIRNQIMESFLQVNPSLANTLKKKVFKRIMDA